MINGTHIVGGPSVGKSNYAAGYLDNIGETFVVMGIVAILGIIYIVMKRR